MPASTETWRSYLSQECGAEVERLAEAYPDERSLYVDLLDVHSFDEGFLQDLFEDPAAGFGAGEAALEELLEVSGPVHLRVENNPQQRSVERIRAYHVGDLVTVSGVVESVGPPRASAVSAAYECPVCATAVRLDQAGIEMETPKRCENCGWDGAFSFRIGDSEFVDLQKIVLAAEPADAGWITSLPAYLDDDVVGTASEGDTTKVTGIVRVHREGGTNEFTLYLDALAVQEDRQMSETETLDGVLDSHWGLTGE